MKPKWLKTASDKLGRYKYAALVILLGTAILLLPKDAQQPRTEANPEQSILAESEKDSLQTALKSLLQQMQGVGRAEVLLSLDTGVRNSFWQDAEDEKQTQTVFSQSGNEKTPALKSREYPKYRGAVIVCDGADNANVELSVKEAVSDLTGLGSDKITVIKMKVQ